MTSFAASAQSRRILLSGWATYFGTTPQFWMNLQANYELELVQDERGAEIAGRSRPYRAA